MASRFLLALVAASGCAHEAPLRPPEPRSYAPVGDYSQAIAEARSARSDAEKIPGPNAAELESAGANDEAISGILRAWASARRDATVAAERAYEKALAAAPGPVEEVEVRGELAALWLALQEDVEVALFAASPAQYRDDPSLVSYIQMDIVEALKPLREKVAIQLASCRALAGDYPNLGGALGKCNAAAERFAETNGPHGARAASSGDRDRDRAIAVAATRPILPTTRPKPCTFKGSVILKGSIYRDSKGGEPIRTLDGEQAIEVDALDAAPAIGGRTKISIAWPTPLDGYLETERAPFVLKRQVDIVASHVWAPQGERVWASEARGPTVRVIRNFDEAPKPSRNDAAKLDKRLFCYDIELAVSPLRNAESASASEVRLKTDSSIPLFAAPGGKEVARIAAPEARLVERRGNYAHISSSSPMGFDGWIKATSLAPVEAPR